MRPNFVRFWEEWGIMWGVERRTREKMPHKSRRVYFARRYGVINRASKLMIWFGSKLMNLVSRKPRCARAQSRWTRFRRNIPRSGVIIWKVRRNRMWMSARGDQCAFQGVTGRLSPLGENAYTHPPEKCTTFHKNS